MSIASEIQRLQQVRERIYTAIDDKGGLTQEDASSSMAFEKIPDLIQRLPVQQGAGVMFDAVDDPPDTVTFFGEVIPMSLTQDPKEYLFHLKIQEGTRVIGEDAFSNCVLFHAELPDSVREIRCCAFRECGNMEINGLPRELERIEDDAFSACHNLVFDTIPAGVRYIGSCAFSQCDSLEDITFLGTPEYIDENAFASCRGIASIKVPWSKGEVAGAPWGAVNATVVYNGNAEE